MNLNDYSKKIHEANQKWWIDLETGAPIERNKAELRMLIISELAECLEGERKNLQDDKLPHRKMAEVEMADVVIRVLDYAGGFGIPLNDIPEDQLVLMAGLEVPENKAEFLFTITRGVCDDQDAEYVGLRCVIWFCETYCKKFGYDLWGAVEEKLKFNATREDHTIEARKQANGKKF